MDTRDDDLETSLHRRYTLHRICLECNKLRRLEGIHNIIWIKIIEIFVNVYIYIKIYRVNVMNKL